MQGTSSSEPTGVNLLDPPRWGSVLGWRRGTCHRTCLHDGPVVTAAARAESGLGVPAAPWSRVPSQRLLPASTPWVRAQGDSGGIRLQQPGSRGRPHLAWFQGGGKRVPWEAEKTPPLLPVSPLALFVDAPAPPSLGRGSSQPLGGAGGLGQAETAGTRGPRRTRFGPWLLRAEHSRVPFSPAAPRDSWPPNSPTPGLIPAAPRLCSCTALPMGASIAPPPRRSSALRQVTWGLRSPGKPGCPGASCGRGGHPLAGYTERAVN